MMSYDLAIVIRYLSGRRKQFSVNNHYLVHLSKIKLCDKRTEEEH